MFVLLYGYSKLNVFFLLSSIYSSCFNYFLTFSNMGSFSIIERTFSLPSLPVAYLIISVICVSYYIGCVIFLVKRMIRSQIVRNKMIEQPKTTKIRFKNYKVLRFDFYLRIDIWLKIIWVLWCWRKGLQHDHYKVWIFLFLNRILASKHSIFLAITI